MHDYGAFAFSELGESSSARKHQVTLCLGITAESFNGTLKIDQKDHFLSVAGHLLGSHRNSTNFPVKIATGAQIPRRDYYNTPPRSLQSLASRSRLYIFGATCLQGIAFGLFLWLTEAAPRSDNLPLIGLTQEEINVSREVGEGRIETNLAVHGRRIPEHTCKPVHSP